MKNRGERYKDGNVRELQEILYRINISVHITLAPFPLLLVQKDTSKAALDGLVVWLDGRTAKDRRMKFKGGMWQKVIRMYLGRIRIVEVR